MGGRGASVNVRSDKVTGNTGIPGTGISYRERLYAQSTEPSASKPGIGAGVVVFVHFLLIVLVFVFAR